MDRKLGKLGFRGCSTTVAWMVTRREMALRFFRFHHSPELQFSRVISSSSTDGGLFDGVGGRFSLSSLSVSTFVFAADIS